MPSAPEPLVPLEFYCDSSSHRKSTFMVAGGLAFRRTRYAEISDAIQALKRGAGISGEMKWSEYRGGARRRAYEAVVDLCFDLVRAGKAGFHCIIGQFSEFDHRGDDDGTPDRSVSKLYFQLALHRVCRLYGSRCAISIYPDEGNDSRELVQFRQVLCARALRQYDAARNCVRVVQPQPSDRHNCDADG